MGRGRLIRDEHGNLEKLSGTVLDITEQKKLQRELDLRRREALEAVKAKSEFLANMSHEIRTPLNGVIGMTEILKDETNDEGLLQKIQIIASSGATLLHLINDILDYSKLDAKRIDLENRPYDLCQTLDEVLQLLGNEAMRKGLLLTPEISPNVPQKVMGDPFRVKQILTNLVSNAIKFTEKGSVTVKADWGDSGRLTRSIVDTGIGIRADKQEHLFQSFSQVDSSTSRKFGGTGLGLAISKGLVELMGGKIWIDSREGHGSTFACEIPAPAALAAESNAELPAQDQFALPEGLQILVAEDNPVNHIVVQNFPRKLGYEADFVTDGEQAVSWARSKLYPLIPRFQV